MARTAAQPRREHAGDSPRIRVEDWTVVTRFLLLMEGNPRTPYTAPHMSSTRRELSRTARTLPRTPGAYLFRDARGRVLYIGKAKSLRKRVLQYFDRQRTDPAKREMVTFARTIDTIVTKTEVEALALEAALIQQYDPPYNVRLVDDSSSLYVTITNDTYPTVSLTRRGLPAGAWVRGPYPSARAIRRTLREARKLFPWCEFGSQTPAASDRNPCFAYHLGLCPGICTGAITLEEYHQTIEQLKRFLDGDTREALRALRGRMETLSATQEYERAAHVRDTVRAIEQATTPQNVVTPRAESVDAIGLSRHGTHTSVAVLQVRRGRVVGTQVFSLLHPSVEPSRSILRGFLLQYYHRARADIGRIVTPEPVDDAGDIAAWVATALGTRVTLAPARRGWMRRLLEIATTNADEALRSSLMELTSPANLRTALADLATALTLPAPPERVEAYDISNIQGQLATASMVVFRGGAPAPSAYRKFHIAAEGTPDDVGMMREVLQRRFSRHAKTTQARGRGQQGVGKRAPHRPTPHSPLPTPSSEWPLPDLILLDGGKGQLNVGVEVLATLGLSIPIAALAKREEELCTLQETTNRKQRTRNGATRPIATGSFRSVRLPRTSPALYLIQRLRDEAHRFTLGYHRLLRSKRMTRSLLEEIPGVGPATRKKLLRHFGSLRALRDASENELATLVGTDRARQLLSFLRPPAPASHTREEETAQ